MDQSDMRPRLYRTMIHRFSPFHIMSSSLLLNNFNSINDILCLSQSTTKEQESQRYDKFYQKLNIFMDGGAVLTPLPSTWIHLSTELLTEQEFNN